MKNFKLLLASTAILAMGAIVANAENPSVTMKVGVNINRASTFEKLQDLNYGSVIIPDNTKEFILSMDSKGTVTAYDGDGHPDSSIHIVGDAHTGITEGVPCPLLELPGGEITLDNIPDNGNYNVTASLSAINCYNAGDDGISDDTAIIQSSELHIASDGPLASGQYSGSFTITAVYPN